ncbi:MAG: hypothetical protein DWQ07_18705 [Chloroflexi bacterium]|nr:MAG: hypothetical protein DWQ07_18705 [Chloroflexota bacterium]MBL1194963.1 hypothetical protein [Chloroflexota bacterium]NOH12253.1 hypothetical protein [Chloroflexota bacterium]
MTTTPHRHAGEVVLLLAPHAGQATLLTMAAHLTVRGPLIILDAGTRFDTVLVAKQLRLIGLDPADYIDNIQVARVFTMLELVDALERTSQADSPFILLDTLATFFNPKTRTPDCYRILTRCLAEIERLAVKRPLFLSARLISEDLGDRAGLYARLEGVATQVIRHTNNTPLPPHHILKETPMGRNSPTARDMMNDTESMLKRFIEPMQPDRRKLFSKLMGRARHHADSIAEAGYLLPFEVVLLAILLEVFAALVILTERVDILIDKIDALDRL